MIIDKDEAAMLARWCDRKRAKKLAQIAYSRNNLNKSILQLEAGRLEEIAGALRRREPLEPEG